MNIIDTRDLYKRQCELQEELDGAQALLDEAQEALEAANEDEEGRDCPELDEAQEALIDAKEALTTWQYENQEELDDLNRLESEVGKEWMHGEALIDEDDWEEYCEELCRDIGAIGENSDFIVIDWTATAEGIDQDYSQVDYQGSTYYFRAS